MTYFKLSDGTTLRGVPQVADDMKSMAFKDAEIMQVRPIKTQLHGQQGVEALWMRLENLVVNLEHLVMSWDVPPKQPKIVTGSQDPPN